MTSNPLLAMTCDSVNPTELDGLAQYLTYLHSDWTIVDGRYIERQFNLPDFKTALALVNGIGDIAERHFHHPDLTLSWGNVGVILVTHSVNRLTLNDLILAAHIDALKCDIEN